MNKKTIFSLIKEMMESHFFTLDELAEEFGLKVDSKNKNAPSSSKKTSDLKANIQTNSGYYSFPVYFEDGIISYNQRDEAIPIGIAAEGFVFSCQYVVDKRFPATASKSHGYIALHKETSANNQGFYATIIDVKVWEKLWNTEDLKRMSQQFKKIGNAQPFNFSQKHWAQKKEKRETKIVCWWIEDGKFCSTDKNLPSEALFRPVFALKK